jgi:hypothetical protein
MSAGISVASRSTRPSAGCLVSRFQACNAVRPAKKDTPSSRSFVSSDSPSTALFFTLGRDSTNLRAVASSALVDDSGNSAPEVRRVIAAARSKRTRVRRPSTARKTSSTETPYRESPIMGNPACARCSRTWCVRPVSGRANTSAAPTIRFPFMVTNLSPVRVESACGCTRKGSVASLLCGCTVYRDLWTNSHQLR